MHLDRLTERAPAFLLGALLLFLVVCPCSRSFSRRLSWTAALRCLRQPPCSAHLKISG